MSERNPTPTASWTGGPRYARVAVARPFPQPFTYSIPAWLADRLTIGHVVMVPLGRNSETGYVVEVTERCDIPVEKVRPVSKIVDPTPAFDEKQLRFFEWIADYYLSPLGLVIQTALPAQIKARTVRVLEPTPEGIEAITGGFAEGALAQVLREVIARPGLTGRSLARRLESELEPGAVTHAVEGVVHRGWAEWGDRELSGVRGMVRTMALTVPLDEALGRLPRAGTRMRAVLEAIDRAEGPVDVAALVADQGAGVRPALQKLIEAGVVEEGEREDRDVLAEGGALGPRRPPVLNEDQTKALEALTSAPDGGTFLLFGVTGSGKTEVFLGAARDTLDRGRQVLVLVPEIGLTPQLVGRFKARFGEGVAVLHSGLTGAERLAEWRRIRAGEAQVAVGARSALFAPFRDLGLIVVDEEHDDSYKQDDGVRYHARDLAVVLGRRCRAVVVLASATPSLESWYNAQQERYHLLRLPRRATPRPVPVVERVDMTELVIPEGEERPVLAPQVVRALSETFDAGGKAIVLYNRRGYATLVQCTSCGASWECPNCGISMTLHQRARVFACHYCGLKRPYTGTCTSCGSTALEELGKGTERVAEVLAELFPRVGMERMDADTTAVRGAHHRILERFRDGPARLLVGTQIVAKGHDIPDVHTAVVVSADQGLRLPDFRAAERTWALLVQVAGRAGRGAVAGRVLVQTWKADHYVLDALDDAEGFYAIELKLRKTLRYPPVSRLALVRLDGVDRGRVLDAGRDLAQALRVGARPYPGVDVLGPALAAMARLVGRWRVQVVLRGGDVRAFRAFLHAHRALLDGASGKGVRVSVDIDPRHLM